MAVKRGIDQAVAEAVKSIAAQAKKVKSNDDLRKVATVSANWNKDIGELIAQAFDKVGTDGVITVEEGKCIDNELELVEGMQFDKGFISAYFMTNPNTMEAVLEDCLHPAAREEDLQPPRPGARAGEGRLQRPSRC